jgi:hypothetical protein
MTKTTAHALMVGWASLPAGAIWTILTGDLRPLGIGLVLFLTTMAVGAILLDVERKKVASQELAKANAQRLLDDLAKRAQDHRQ